MYLCLFINYIIFIFFLLFNLGCYLPFANTFRPPIGRTIEPAAVKTGKAASIYVGIVTATKIPTDSAIRFFGDNAFCCRFKATNNNGSKQDEVFGRTMIWPTERSNGRLVG